MTQPVRKCQNCEYATTENLQRASSQESLLPLSDGKFLDHAEVQRTLCPHCCCIQVHYEPPDRLVRFFAEEYDISDDVQNNIIVIQGQQSKKHLEIKQNLFSMLDQLPEKGTFLEIACGRGELTRLFSQEKPLWECTGIDPSGKAVLSSSDKRVRFIRDFFAEDIFNGQSFDLIVAHGLLNRTPTWPTLKSIARLTSPGGLISIECVTLEQSLFAPYIWDHSFTYCEETMQSYLQSVGFEIIKSFDCISSTQYVCKKIGHQLGEPEIESTFHTTDKTRVIHQKQKDFWQDIKVRFEVEFSQLPGAQVGLFGAGLFSVVLLHLIGKERVQFIIDEIRNGYEIFGIPVIALSEVGHREHPNVLLCIRPQYVKLVMNKLKEKGIPCVSLIPKSLYEIY